MPTTNVRPRDSSTPRRCAQMRAGKQTRWQAGMIGNRRSLKLTTVATHRCADAPSAIFEQFIIRGVSGILPAHRTTTVTRWHLAEAHLLINKLHRIRRCSCHGPSGDPRAVHVESEGNQRHSGKPDTFVDCMPATRRASLQMRLLIRSAQITEAFRGLEAHPSECLIHIFCFKPPTSNMRLGPHWLTRKPSK